MELSDNELLRRAVISILKRIETGGTTPVMLAHSPDQSSTLNNRAERSEPPIVLVVLGQIDSTDNRNSEDGGGTEKRVYENQVYENQISHLSSEPHPGFKKFQISEQRAADAPKLCFMEPDRVCVNSGACEMLGH